MPREPKKPEEKKPRQPMKPETKFGWGLAAFGFACGLIGGLSVTPGASQALLTGLFGFVAGGILTFAGFRRSIPESNEPRHDLAQLGCSLVIFSLSLVPGLAGGILVREYDPVARWFDPHCPKRCPTECPIPCPALLADAGPAARDAGPSDASPAPASEATTKPDATRGAKPHPKPAAKRGAPGAPEPPAAVTPGPEPAPSTPSRTSIASLSATLEAAAIKGEPGDVCRVCEAFCPKGQPAKMFLRDLKERKTLDAPAPAVIEKRPADRPSK